MGGVINKKILSEIHLIYGFVKMPNGFEIDLNKLNTDIVESQIKNSNIKFSKSWDMLNTYLRDHVNCELNINLINKQSWGNFYKPEQITIPLINIDPVDLRNSPDYTCLYGVNVKNCFVKIFYDDNRRKGRTWDMQIENNKFIIFPSNCMYFITNKQKDSVNTILTTTYEFI